MAIIASISSLFRKCIGLFLFIVFALAVTPVSWLHDVIANHHDVCYHHFGEKGKIITKADINCHCMSFVAEPQFIKNGNPPLIASIQPLFSSLLFTFYNVHFYSQHHFYSELRGPPTLA